jgi:hypothetical protein
MQSGGSLPHLRQPTNNSVHTDILLLGFYTVRRLLVDDVSGTTVSPEHSVSRNVVN